MTYKVPVYNIAGEEVEKKSLSDKVFNDENVNEGLIHDFIVMQLANARNPIAHTKTRGEVQRSGRKLYRQKGTGHARVGDAGSPIRRKGGVAFGPRNVVNHSKSMPKKMRRKALFGSLTLKAKDNEILGLNEYKEEPRTKNAVMVLENLKITEKTLLVLPEKDESIIRSFRNIPKLKYVLVNNINPYDLLTHKKVLFVGNSLDKLEEIFVD